MKLLIVNPNTTSSMTEKMLLAARGVAADGTEVVAVTAEYGKRCERPTWISV